VSSKKLIERQRTQPASVARVLRKARARISHKKASVDSLIHSFGRSRTRASRRVVVFVVVVVARTRIAMYAATSRLARVASRACRVVVSIVEK